MPLDLLLWSIPAVFTQYFLRQAAQKNFVIRSQSTWEYVFELVPLSVFSFAFASFVLKFISKFISPNQYEMFTQEWCAICTYPYSFRLLLASILSPLSARIVGMMLGATSYLFPRRNNDPNILSRGDVVFITLKSRKVYVGVLLGKIDKENLGLDIVNLVPIMSGHRDGNHKVTYNTKYPVLRKSSKFIIHIATSEIATIARFDFEMHEQFVKLKRTKVNFPQRSKA